KPFHLIQKGLPYCKQLLGVLEGRPRIVIDAALLLIAVKFEPFTYRSVGVRNGCQGGICGTFWIMIAKSVMKTGLQPVGRFLPHLQITLKDHVRISRVTHRWPV